MQQQILVSLRVCSHCSADDWAISVLQLGTQLAPSVSQLPCPCVPPRAHSSHGLGRDVVGQASCTSTFQARTCVISEHHIG